jgi:hypothetical protein
MAKLIPGLFTRYEFNDDEEISAHILSQENIYAIQNLVAEAAEEKVSLKFDPEKPQLFIQREAELQGNINAYKYLLTMHESSLRARITAIRESQSSSQQG